MKKAIIVNVAKGLLNSGKAWKYFMKELKLSQKELLRLNQTYIKPARIGKYTKNELLTVLSKDLKVSKDKLYQIFVKGGKKLEVNKKILNKLRELKKKGHKIVLESNTTALFASLFVESKLYKEFPSILSYKKKKLLGSKK